MNQQKLQICPRKITFRRIKVFGLTILSTLIAAIKWSYVIPTDITPLTEFFMIFLFILTFGWISLFFWSSLFGFFELLRKDKQPDISWTSAKGELHTKTALLMPVYNESPQGVFANLLAMAEDLNKNGKTKFYDIFVLSDTTDPKVWVEEEKTWLDAKKLMPEQMNIYYRRRPLNTARKAGNIEDFCNKWGADYDFMIVLDADSLLTAETMIRMTQLMEANDDAGIIQAPPMTVNRNTLFARLQQFAGKIYGPIVSAGLSYWQGGDSNYWGHNAIIRVKAFIECCGLPILEGRKPFGGHILSHDFVEAALIRRGGWRAWLIEELKGSYEESPPTIIDFADRDRRWCQGNMQHIKVLVSKSLHPISRIHFTIGIMSYLSSPIWLSFLLIGLFIALGKEIFPPVYFSEAKSLFPAWPIFDQFGTVTLFVISMGMLILPKFLGLIVYIIKNKFKAWSAIKSVFWEIIISCLIAPIMMMFQSKFVLDIFMGKSVGWNTQNRGDLGTSFKDAFNRHIWHTLLGIATIIIVWFYANQLFWWMVPITLGLILSIPISIITSKASVGIWAKKHGYFLIPEEVEVPQILKRANFYVSKLEKSKSDVLGIEFVIKDNLMNNFHILALPINGPAPDFSHTLLKNAEAKLENYINLDIPLNLSKDEEIALLYSPEILQKANIYLKMK
ncbi:MAG: glucans biosynthesis glucosyltransferase MdoH [Alphaproteobacteria bacterium]